jgi:methylated-DNA-[protein]-cysteine S-methyltransferase
VKYCLFETALGTAGVAWTERGICRVELPQRDAARIRRRFSHATQAPPPPTVADAITQMTALFDGQPGDLSKVELDMDGVDDFDRRVYLLARAIPVGETTTYGDIARRLGDVHLAREVGQAMAANRFPMVIPCHRVVAANGRLGGFSAVGGVLTKQRLLEIERANVSWQMALPVDAG